MIRKNRKIRPQRNLFQKIFKAIMIMVFLGFFSVMFCGICLYLYFKQDVDNLTTDMAKISALKDYRPSIVTAVYADDTRKIAEFYKERRIVVPYSKIPQMLVSAFLSAEDSRFFEHPGVDLKSIARAALKNFEAGTVVQGGSTITQQVIKSLMLTPEKSYQRKIKEAVLAYQIDKAFSKEEILYLYLNQIYLGQGAYGVAAAAENYFGKSLDKLTLAECALIAGLPQAPSEYSPFKHLDKAKARQKYVLNRMVVDKYISQAEADQAGNAPVKLQAKTNWYIEHVPYYTEYVRQYVEKKYGSDMLYEQGLKIYTAVNVDIQKAGRRAVNNGLRDLDKRHFGYRGPIRHLAKAEIENFLNTLSKKQKPADMRSGDMLKGVVTRVQTSKITVNLGGVDGIISTKTMGWATKKYDRKASSGLLKNVVKSGDVIWVELLRSTDKGWRVSLEQPPKAQSALLCIEQGTGHVKAVIGGRDFKYNQFNRAIQSRRQPGSSFKPIIYAAALDKGYTPATELADVPFITAKWKPRNYDHRFHGQVLLRKALAKSLNLPIINILDDIGVNYAIRYAKKLGITSKLNPGMALALGASGVSLLEMVKAYSVFANNGHLIEPVFVTKIVDRDGNILEENFIKKKRAIEASTAYLMTSLLQSVVKEGTGRRVRALKRPAAGKTGTTNNTHDAWFVGYTPDYITGAWVGYDKERSLGYKEGGGKSAIPVWLSFMKTVHRGKPIKDFKTPKGIVNAKIDAKTGLLPSEDSKHVIFECFKEGTVPTQYSKSTVTVTEPDQFFKMGM